MGTAAATTEPGYPRAAPAPVRREPPTRGNGPDRASVVLFSLAAFLGVLAILAWQLRSGPSRTTARAVVVVRRVYETTVVETIRGSGSGTSVSQSVSSSGSGALPTAAPATRSSG